MKLVLPKFPPLFFFLLTFLLVFCQFSLAQQSNPIRIGATVSLEGKYQSVSFMVRNGYELWAEQINSRGGLLGRKVELIFYNDKSKVELIRPLYEKLINEDEVDLIFSPYGSSLSMVAAEVAEEYGFVLLAATASSTAIWERGFRYVFGVYSTADRYFLGFLDLVARKRLHSVAIVHSDATFHISAAEGIKKWAALFGLDVIHVSQYQWGDGKLPGIAEELGNLNADAIIFCGYPPACYKFLEILEKKSIRPPGLALTIAPALPEFYDRVGPFAENIFGPSQWEADERIPFPGTNKFISSFIRKVGKEPSYQACASYSAGLILERAVYHAGQINHEMIRKFVRNLDTVTIMGRFKVDSTGKQIGHNAIIIQWQNGKKEIVYPTKMQTAPSRLTTAGSN